MRTLPRSTTLAGCALGAAAGACSADGAAPPRGSCAKVELLVAASDYSSSKLCGVPGSCTAGSDLGADPMLTAGGGRAFFLARDNDLVFEVDAACGRPLSRFGLDALATRDPATGTKRAANPHDAAAAPDGTVVVPLYGAARLAFLKDGAREPETVDLSRFDADGNPQADAVRVVPISGVAKAFVTLERLDDADSLRSKQPSQMLRVDVATRTVEAAIDLVGRNPFNPMSELRGSLFLAEPGNFDAADEDLAGIERFDPLTSTSRLLVRERELAGSVAELAITEGCGAAIVAGPEKDVNPTWVVTFDPETGHVHHTHKTPLLGPTPGYDLQGLAWRGGTLYVGDRRRGGAGYVVHIFERKGACELERSSRTIDLPQRPVALRAARTSEAP